MKDNSSTLNFISPVHRHF